MGQGVLQYKDWYTFCIHGKHSLQKVLYTKMSQCIIWLEHTRNICYWPSTRSVRGNIARVHFVRVYGLSRFSEVHKHVKSEREQYSPVGTRCEVNNWFIIWRNGTLQIVVYIVKLWKLFLTLCHASLWRSLSWLAEATRSSILIGQKLTAKIVVLVVTFNDPVVFTNGLICWGRLIDWPIHHLNAEGAVVKLSTWKDGGLGFSEHIIWSGCWWTTQSQRHPSLMLDGSCLVGIKAFEISMVILGHVQLEETRDTGLPNGVVSDFTREVDIFCCRWKKFSDSIFAKWTLLVPDCVGCLLLVLDRKEEWRICFIHLWRAVIPEWLVVLDWASLSASCFGDWVECPATAGTVLSLGASLRLPNQGFVASVGFLLQADIPPLQSSAFIPSSEAEVQGQHPPNGSLQCDRICVAEFALLKQSVFFRLGQFATGLRMVSFTVLYNELFPPRTEHFSGKLEFITFDDVG